MYSTIAVPDHATVNRALGVSRPTDSPVLVSAPPASPVRGGLELNANDKGPALCRPERAAEDFSLSALPAHSSQGGPPHSAVEPSGSGAPRRARGPNSSLLVSGASSRSLASSDDDAKSSASSDNGRPPPDRFSSIDTLVLGPVSFRLNPTVWLMDLKWRSAESRLTYTVNFTLDDEFKSWFCAELSRQLKFNFAVRVCPKASSKHPRARIVRNLLELMACACAYSGAMPGARVLDVNCSGRVVAPLLHHQIPVLSDRDQGKKVGRRMTMQMTSCDCHPVCLCAEFYSLYSVDSVYYHTPEKMAEMIERTCSRVGYIVHHVFTGPTYTELDYHHENDGSVSGSAPDKTTPFRYRHTALWDTCPDMFERDLLLQVGTHCLFRYRVKAKMVAPAVVIPPAVLVSAPIQIVEAAAKPKQVKVSEDLRWEDHEYEHVEDMVSQAGWFWSFVVSRQGSVTTRVIQLPMALVDVCSMLNVSTNATSSFESFSHRCRANMQDKIAAAGVADPALVLQRATILAYSRAIRAIGPAKSEIKYDPVAAAYVSGEEITHAPRASLRAIVFGALGNVAAAVSHVASATYQSAVTTWSSMNPPVPKHEKTLWNHLVGTSIISFPFTSLTAYVVKRAFKPALDLARGKAVLRDFNDGALELKHRVTHVAPSQTRLPIADRFVELDKLCRSGNSVTHTGSSRRQLAEVGSEAGSMRTVAVTHAWAYCVNNSDQNVMAAISARLEASIRPRDPLVVSKLAILCAKVASKFPKAVPSDPGYLEFVVKTVGEWIQNPAYNEEKRRKLRQAHEDLLLDPKRVLERLQFESFLKKEVAFKCLTGTFEISSFLFKPRIVSSPDPIVNVACGPFISSMQEACSRVMTAATPFPMFLNMGSLEVGAWARRCELHLSSHFIEGDASNFDGSQSFELGAIIADFYKGLGAPGEKHAFLDILHAINAKKVFRFPNPSGTRVQCSGVNPSGFPDTTLRNNILNGNSVALAIIECLPEEMRAKAESDYIACIGTHWDDCGDIPFAIIVAGDDNLICVHEKYRPYVNSERLSLVTSGLGLTYNFIDRRSLYEAEFVSSIFMPVTLFDDVITHTGKVILTSQQCAATSYDCVGKPGRCIAKLGWTTASPEDIPDTETSRYYGEKAYGQLSSLACYVPLLTEYLEMVVARFYQPDRPKLDPNYLKYSCRRSADRNDGIVSQNPQAKEEAMAWFYQRYGLGEADIRDFLTRFADVLRQPDDTSWHLQHPVSDALMLRDF